MQKSLETSAARKWAAKTDRKQKREWDTGSDFGNAEHAKKMSYFLEAVGITPLKASDYDEVYGQATWHS